MNKFANVVRAVRLLTSSTPRTTAEDQFVWITMVNEAIDAQFEPVTETEELEWQLMIVEVQLNASKSVFDRCSCGAVMEKGAAVCDDCLEDSEFLVPCRCKGCGKEDRRELLDFCRDCEVDGTEFRLRGGHL
jgi:hypothetical protein